MYQVKIKSEPKSLSELDNSSLICSYVFLKKTAAHFYHRKLIELSKREKKAIIKDLALYQNVKKQKYLLRCSTPQKWIENWDVYKNLKNELERRKIKINNFEIS